MAVGTMAAKASGVVVPQIPNVIPCTCLAATAVVVVAVADADTGMKVLGSQHHWKRSLPAWPVMHSTLELACSASAQASLEWWEKRCQVWRPRQDRGS